MRAIWLKRYAERLKVTRLDTVPKPIAASSQVLVKMRAAPINPADVAFVRGLYGVKKPLPVSPGTEGYGTVVEVGSPSLSHLIGKPVACSWSEELPWGTWAEYCLTESRCVLPLPEESTQSLSDGERSCLVINPFTALGLYEAILKGCHTTVVLTAAVSALGRMLLRLVAQEQKGKIRFVNLVRRPEQVKILEELGENVNFDTSSPQFEEQFKQYCKQDRPSILIDAVGGPQLGFLTRHLAKYGEIYLYGSLSFKMVGEINPLDIIFQGKVIKGFYLSDWFKHKEKEGDMTKYIDLWMKHITTSFRTKISRSFPLEQTEEAIAHYNKHMTEGKIILTP